MKPFLFITRLNHTFLITLTALVAFAANSILCRMALVEQLIDPVSFTATRLFSGAIMLVILVFFFTPPPKGKAHDKNRVQLGNVLTKLSGTWPASIALFIYALCFSLAYIELSAGTGALILFAGVQLTLVVMSMLKGYKMSWLEWLGLALSFTGFVYLVIPSIQSPTLLGFVFMTLSGIAWAYYTLFGLASQSPLNDSCGNFIRTLPFATISIAVLLISSWSESYYSEAGIVLAIISGAVTSGFGYFLWYAVLPKFTSTQAGVLQLSVPLIATVGGMLFVNEPITLRISISSVFILCGILIVMLNKKTS